MAPPRRARPLDKNGDLTVEQYSAGLAKILGNILAHPNEDKYRRIKAKAKLVQQTILAADGGLAAFLALGFRKESITVTAPPPPPPQTYEQTTTIATAAAEASLVQMGFRRSAARSMLTETGGDISLALDRLAGHPEYMGIDDPSVEEEAQRLEAAKRQAAAMRQAASTPVRTEDVYVLQTVDEAALRAALEVYSSELPQAIARKKEERRAEQRARAKTEARAAAAERAASQRRWGEDERDRAARRRNAPAPAPAPIRDDTGGLIDAQDREFQQAAAADGAAAPVPQQSNPHATLNVAVRLPGAPPMRRQFLAGWSLTQLADFLGRQLPDETSARLTVAGARQPLVIDGRTLAECNLGGSTLYVEAIKVQPPSPMQEADDDEGYRAALSEANVEVVAAVDDLAPRNFTTGAALKTDARVRSPGADLPQPSCASTIF